MVKTRPKLETAARRFLRSGFAAKGADHAALAAECDRQVRAETQRSLPKALALAEKFVEFSRSKPAMPLQIALRALGWAALCCGKYRQSEAAYLEARKLVLREPFDRAQIDKILIDVYMYLGRPQEARRRAQRAISSFRRLKEFSQVAKTRINYGNLLHRQDRHRAARRQYEAARRHLERGRGNELVLALCYYNLANTLVQLFEFAEARKCYERARENFLRQHHELFANESDYGLAWLAALNNDYHVALRLLYGCEEKYRKAGRSKGVLLCVLDRAEVYLSLNLFMDAFDAAREAERRSRSLGLHYEAGKAAFFRARSAHALGRSAEVRRALQRAREEFAREGNKEFEAAVRLFEAQVVSGRPAAPARLQRIRSRLADRQLPLWAAIGDLQLLVGRPDDTAARRRLSRNPAVRSVPHLLAHWQTLQGDREFRRGALDRAMNHWTRAAEVLDLVRAKLPPVELRSTFVRGRTDPYERIISGVVQSDPERATAWIDRLKTVGAWAASGEFFAATRKRTQAEESLTRLAHQVSALAEQIGPVPGTRSSDAFSAQPSLRRLQRDVRDRLGMMEHQPPRLEAWFDRFQAELREVSNEFPVVQFCIQKEDLITLVHERGDARLHRYRGARRLLQEWSGAWQVQLNRSLLSEEGCSANDLADERRLFAELGDYFWSPLEIDRRHERVLIIPDGQLSNLPWSAFIHRGNTLTADHGLIISPSVQHHLYARAMTPAAGKVGVFVGDRHDLDPARAEFGSLLDSSMDVELHDPCRRADWPSEGEWAVWHFTGHARYRTDNPFYSSLLLQDGPLFGADFRLKNCRVGLTTLAACRTAHQTVVPGEEATGLVRCLLEMGSRNVVGSHWAVSDRSAAVWMSHYYKSILDGRAACEAVREASLATKEQYPSVYDWASFSVYGAG